MTISRSIQRLITSSLIVLLAGSATAQVATETDDYTLMGVLQIGDELWLKLRFKDGGTYTTSNQRARDIQAVSYNMEKGYAVVRDPNGRLAKVYLNKPAASAGLRIMAATPHAPITEIPDFNNMTAAEINAFAKQYSPSMTRSTSAKKVTITPGAFQSTPAKVSPVVPVLASEASLKEHAELIRDVVEQRARNNTSVALGNTRKSGGLVTAENYLPSPNQELEE